MTLTLTTARLTLRPPVPADLDHLVAGIGNYAVAKFLTPVPHPYGHADGEAWLGTVPATPTLGDAVFAIDLGEAGFIGCVGYQSELGYWIAEPFWGRGIVTEAARAVLDWAFESGAAEPLLCGAHIDNAASMRVQEKLGFAVTHTSRVFARARQQEIERFHTVVTRAGLQAACAQLDAPTGSGKK